MQWNFIHSIYFNKIKLKSRVLNPISSAKSKPLQLLKAQQFLKWN